MRNSNTADVKWRCTCGSRVEYVNARRWYDARELAVALFACEPGQVWVTQVGA